MSANLTSPAVGTLQILLVDDEPAIRDIFSMFLEAHGHSVTSAEDGTKALLACEETDFEVVVTDRVMPLMDGDALARNLRQRYPDLPIVMITGQVSEEEGALQNIDVLVRKPFTLTKLLAGITEAIAKRRAIRHQQRQTQAA